MTTTEGWNGGGKVVTGEGPGDGGVHCVVDVTGYVARFLGAILDE